MLGVGREELLLNNGNNNITIRNNKDGKKLPMRSFFVNENDV